MSYINNIHIKPSSPAEADTAAKLCFMAYHKFSYDIFGQIGEEAAIERFKQLWLHGNNRFGYRFSYTAEINNKAVAIMTCYPSPQIKKLAAPTLWYLTRIGKLPFILHLISHLPNFYYFANDQEFPACEFYLATLSVLPEYRSMGIGAKMLQHARKLSRDLNLQNCSLHVTAENEGGIRFYERNGFKKAPPQYKSPTYFKMVNPH